MSIDACVCTDCDEQRQIKTHKMICAWCKYVMQFDMLGLTGDTHGICAKCAAAMRQQYLLEKR